MRSLRSFVAALIVGMAVAACGGSAASTPAQTGTPTPAATVTSAPTEEPTATPLPTTDGEGPEYVFGTDSFVVSKDGTETVVGDVTQLRGQEMIAEDKLNDPRVTGTGHITLNADIQEKVAAEWGTLRIENAGGAWEGTWTGASWNASVATSVSGWLTGSGGYAGLTYYFHVYGPFRPFQIEGIIFPGSPPTP